MKKTYYPVEEHIVRCSCHSPTHMIVFRQWGHDEYTPTLDIYPQLDVYLPWWRRVVLAARYVLNLHPRTMWPHWAEVSVDRKDLVPLRDFLTRQIEGVVKEFDEKWLDKLKDQSKKLDFCDEIQSVANDLTSDCECELCTRVRGIPN